MGLPCPNISTTGHSCHPLLEWISVQDMEKSVETIFEPVKVWEERADAEAEHSSGFRSRARPLTGTREPLNCRRVSGVSPLPGLPGQRESVYHALRGTFGRSRYLNPLATMRTRDTG